MKIIEIDDETKRRFECSQIDRIVTSLKCYRAVLPLEDNDININEQRSKVAELMIDYLLEYGYIKEE